MLWWLRDLRYSPIGRAIALLIVAGLIGGGGWFAFNALTTRTIQVDEAEVASAQGDELVVPLTPMRGQCEQAKYRLRKLIESGAKYGAPESDSGKLALRAFSQAARTCTFTELAPFDREIVAPWVSGADMATILQDYEATYGAVE